MAVTCVVVAFHRPESLARLLIALDDSRIETIVVNVEDDAVIAKLPAVKVLGLKANVGYATAVNAGVRHAKHPVVVFMNDDVFISADAVMRLAARIDEAVDVAVPGIVDREGRVERTIFPLLSPAALLREWVLAPDNPPPWWPWNTRHERWRLPKELERIHAASAVVVAVRTELIRRIPMPEDYFLYWEEIDWFFQVARAGGVSVYDPAVQAQHWGDRTVVHPLKCALLAKNAVRCVRNTRGRSDAARAWPVSVLWSVRLFLTSVAAGAGWPVIRARVAGVRASIAAWREI